MKNESINEQKTLCLDLLDRFLATVDESKKVRFIEKLSMKGIAATLKYELSSGNSGNGGVAAVKEGRLEELFAVLHQRVNGSAAVLGTAPAGLYGELRESERLLMRNLRAEKEKGGKKQVRI